MISFHVAKGSAARPTDGTLPIVLWPAGQLPVRLRAIPTVTESRMIRIHEFHYLQVSEFSQDKKSSSACSRPGLQSVVDDSVNAS